MRVLIVDYYYPAFLDGFYRDRPELVGASFEEHRTALRSAMFGETAFEVDALRALGHDADDVIVNAYPVRRAWAREHDLVIGPEMTWRLRGRQAPVPWASRWAGAKPSRSTREIRIPWFSKTADEAWMWATLVAQVRNSRPDVVHIACMDLVPSAVVAELASVTRLVVGQVATALPTHQKYRHYGVVVSSIPSLVQQFREEGTAAHYLALGFEPAVLSAVPAVPRDVPVSFVGSFSRRYSNRQEILEAVARTAPLQTWTADSRRLSLRSPIRKTVQGRAFGRDFYTVMARSRITINTHGTVAGNAANNLRLYEATGMGALLITDARTNLNEIFDVGREVVAYEDPRGAAELAKYYVEHPKEAAAIAGAGQVRTLRDHTWANRMEQLSRIMQKSMRS